MSAFVVEDKTINRVASYIAYHLEQEDTWAYRQIAEAAGLGLHEDDFHRKLAVTMHLLNVDAVNERYGENEAPDPEFEAHLVPPSSDLAVLKALSCWLYQCAEGDVPERPLYKAMRELEARLALRIIHRLPEYDRLPWE